MYALSRSPEASCIDGCEKSRLRELLQSFFKKGENRRGARMCVIFFVKSFLKKYHTHSGASSILALLKELIDVMRYVPCHTIRTSSSKSLFFSLRKKSWVAFSSIKLSKYSCNDNVPRAFASFEILMTSPGSLQNQDVLINSCYRLLFSIVLRTHIHSFNMITAIFKDRKRVPTVKIGNKSL